MDSADSFAAIEAGGQQALIQFLNVDLDLAFTFLQTARFEARNNPARGKAAFEKAVAALVAIRRFQDRIKDPVEREKVHRRADELEVAMKELEGDPRQAKGQ